MSTDLFRQSLDVPYVGVTCLRLERPDASERSVLIAYSAEPPSAYHNIVVSVDRYSPEWSILRAASEMMLGLEQAQRPVNSVVLREAWDRAAREYVAPF